MKCNDKNDNVGVSNDIPVVSSNTQLSRTKTRRPAHRIPLDILNDIALQAAICVLPENYNFEIPKTVWKIRRSGARMVALQFPEGLLMYACTISDILERFTGADTLIMADVTYGACCVDDFTAVAMGANLLVHYGHSCLVGIDRTGIEMLYVFVDIKIDTGDFIERLEKFLDFPTNSRLALVSTIQFGAALQTAKVALSSTYSVTTPQVRPLSQGEILGCTSPRVANIDAIVYLGDGRFHLESMMMHNPDIPAYKYDPYNKSFTREYLDHEQMLRDRDVAMAAAAAAGTVGIVLGTLGRQGSPDLVERVKAYVTGRGKKFVTVLLSEIYPDKLKLFSDIDVWVQVACPRLSIDWGTCFNRPLLYPGQLAEALGYANKLPYIAMDYYSYSARGAWTPNYDCDPVSALKARKAHRKVQYEGEVTGS